MFSLSSVVCPRIYSIDHGELKHRDLPSALKVLISTMLSVETALKGFCHCEQPFAFIF